MIDIAETEMYNETGRNTAVQGKAPFVLGDIRSNRLKPRGRIKQPVALYAPLLVSPSWILGSMLKPSVAALRHASHVAMQQPELR